MCTVFKPCSRRLSLGRPKVYENTQHRFVAGVTGMIARRRSGKAGSSTTCPTCRNLVPRSCDPRKVTRGSGIIRFKEESDWPLIWNAQFCLSQDSWLPYYPRASRSFPRIAGSGNEIGHVGDKTKGFASCPRQFSICIDAFPMRGDMP